jgi:CRP-like cAMP-binding protein
LSKLVVIYVFQWSSSTNFLNTSILFLLQAIMTYSNNQTHNSHSQNLHNSTIGAHLPQRVFSRREIIPSRNDVLWRIESGAARTVTWDEDGTYVTLGYWGVGDVIGYPLSKINPYQIECLITTQVTILPAHLWFQDMNGLLSHIQKTEELLSIVNCKRVALRMWLFLVWLSEKFGRDVEQGKMIDLNVTHQEIAEVLNTTRVTVTRLLQHFEEEGKLIRNRRKMILTPQN